MNKYKKRGFSLFELLVVISIIGILVAVASVSFSSAQKKARDARRLEDMQSVAKAAESFYAVNSASYPPNNTTPWLATGIGDTILATFPSDPKGVSPYLYTYSSVSPYSLFCACATVENPTNANSGAACDFSAVTKTYYCVRNQQ